MMDQILEIRFFFLKFCSRRVNIWRHWRPEVLSLKGNTALPALVVASSPQQLGDAINHWLFPFSPCRDACKCAGLLNLCPSSKCLSFLKNQQVTRSRGVRTVHFINFSFEILNCYWTTIGVSFRSGEDGVKK